jgi:hypothetical protein
MATPSLETDYLFLAERLEQQLKNEVNGLVVRGIEQLAQATDATVRHLEAFVLWEGESFPEAEASNASRASLMVTQTWTVLLAVRNASQVDPNARNSSAGPFLSSIHKAVHRWVPDGCHRPFKRVNGRNASYGNNTALYPLTFSITLNI